MLTPALARDSLQQIPTFSLIIHLHPQKSSPPVLFSTYSLPPHFSSCNLLRQPNTPIFSGTSTPGRRTPLPFTPFFLNRHNTHQNPDQPHNSSLPFQPPAAGFWSTSSFFSATGHLLHQSSDSLPLSLNSHCCKTSPGAIDFLYFCFLELPLLPRTPTPWISPTSLFLITHFTLFFLSLVMPLKIVDQPQFIDSPVSASPPFSSYHQNFSPHVNTCSSLSSLSRKPLPQTPSIGHDRASFTLSATQLNLCPPSSSLKSNTTAAALCLFIFLLKSRRDPISYPLSFFPYPSSKSYPIAPSASSITGPASPLDPFFSPRHPPIVSLPQFLSQICFSGFHFASASHTLHTRRSEPPKPLFPLPFLPWAMMNVLSPHFSFH